MKVFAAVVFALVLSLSTAAYLPSSYIGGYGYPATYALAAAPAITYAAAPAISYAAAPAVSYAAVPVNYAVPAAPAAAGYVRYETPNFSYSYAHPVGGYLRRK